MDVLAHSTHVRGGGRYIDGVEYVNATVNLATAIGRKQTARLALGYSDPGTINPHKWVDHGDEGILYVPKAGEMLYRVKKQ